MKKQLTTVLKFLIFLGVGVGILYYVYLKESKDFLEKCIAEGKAAADCRLIDKIVQDFQDVNYWWIALVLLAFTISNISRAIRWNMLLRQLDYRPRMLNSFFSIIIGYFANLALPRIGEVIRAGTIARYERIAPEKALATIVVGRICDLISMLVVVGLALLVQYNEILGYFNSPPAVQEEEMVAATGVNWWLWLGIGALVAIAVLAFVLRKRHVRDALKERLRKIATGFMEGLQSIRKLDRPWIFILHSLNIWVMYFLMTYLAFFSFAPTAHLGPAAGLTVFVFGALGILVPSPGGIGTYQLFVTQALVLYGIEQDNAFSFANILFFSVQIGCNVIVGLLSLILLPIYNRNYIPQHHGQANEPMATDQG